jgi:hypothetical protein
MLAPLLTAVVLNLGPAQAGSLELKNVRPTYWVLGQARKGSKLLPGDVYVVAFDIEGLQVKKDGRVLYGMGMELIRNGKKPKTEFKREPQNLEAVNSLGGSRLPSYALSVIGTDTPPGQYTLKVTVIDRVSKKTATLVRNFEVIPPRLGFVRVGLSYGNNLPAPPLAVPGQALWVNFFVTGFSLHKKTRQPDVTIEMRILDEAGKPTTGTPFSGEAKRALKELPHLILIDPIPLQINRSGKFKISLKATDNVTKKTATQTLDFTVIEQPGQGK